MCCTIWYHLHNLKNMKTPMEVCSACNFTKNNTLPWVFFTFFKLYKWYQIAQRTTYTFPKFISVMTVSDLTIDTIRNASKIIFSKSFLIGIERTVICSRAL